MKLNGKELAIYAASRVGQADKEGKLWMRECEGLVRKRESELEANECLVNMIMMTIIYGSIQSALVYNVRKSTILY